MIDKPDIATAVVSAAAIAGASPLLGDYALILLFNLLGAFVALSRAEPDGLRRRWDGAIFIARSVAVAFSFSWVAVVITSERTGYDTHFVLLPVALIMGWIGDAWLSKALILKIRDYVFSRFMGRP